MKFQNLTLSKTFLKQFFCTYCMDIQVDENLIKQVAKNSNLVLTAEEIKGFEADFRDILANFEKMARAEVSDIPSFHPVQIKNKTREDVVKQGLSHKDAMKNVSESNDGLIRGPKVI